MPIVTPKEHMPNLAPELDVFVALRLHPPACACRAPTGESWPSNKLPARTRALLDARTMGEAARRTHRAGSVATDRPLVSREWQRDHQVAASMSVHAVAWTDHAALFRAPSPCTSLPALRTRLPLVSELALPPAAVWAVGAGAAGAGVPGRQGRARAHPLAARRRAPRVVHAAMADAQDLPSDEEGQGAPRAPADSAAAPLCCCVCTRRPRTRS